MNDTASNLGLGARISMLFAVGGLLVSLVLAATTLLLTRQQLLDTRPSRTSPPSPTPLPGSRAASASSDSARPGFRPPNWTVTTCRLPSSN